MHEHRQMADVPPRNNVGWWLRPRDIGKLTGLMTRTAPFTALPRSSIVECVVDADAADDLLVTAKGPNGEAPFVVDATGSGVERTDLCTMDLPRPQATVRFGDVPTCYLNVG